MRTTRLPLRFPLACAPPVLHFARPAPRHSYSTVSSALALETAIQCTPNVALLAESDATLANDISAVADLVLSRRAQGENFGVVVIADAFLSKHGLSDEAAVGKLVKVELATRSDGVGKYKALCHHFSVQLRGSFPSAFDCRLGHALGVAAATHAVSVLLCTVTFHANLAHSLTRSP